MTQVKDQQPSAKPTPVKTSRARPWIAVLAIPELMVSALLLGVLCASTALEPRFRDVGYLLDRSSLFMEVGMMAAGMTFVIIGGHIDLSCASILALVGAIVTTLSVHHHVPFALLLAMTPFLGAILGAVNGVVVARLGLPSLVVTLGTMAIYRGLAQVLVGDHSEPVPDWFKGLDQVAVGRGSLQIPMPMIILICSAVVLGLVLHRTVFGRWVFAMGTNTDAALYSGVPVARVTIGFFMLSGVLSSLASLMMLSRLGIARYDNASGQELDVITAVVLGGASIYGGRGTMLGTIMALLLIGLLQTAMGVANIKSEYQTTANGALLIAAVLLSNGISKLRR